MTVKKWLIINKGRSTGNYILDGEVKAITGKSSVTVASKPLSLTANLKAIETSEEVPEEKPRKKKDEE